MTKHAIRVAFDGTFECACGIVLTGATKEIARQTFVRHMRGELNPPEKKKAAEQIDKRSTAEKMKERSRKSHTPFKRRYPANTLTNTI